MQKNLVSFHFTLRDQGGSVLDFSVGGEPVHFVEGEGQILDGLEEGLATLQVGAKAHVTVPPQKGYGLRDEGLVHRVPRAMLPVDGELRVGDRFQTEPEPGSPVVTIAAIEGDEVTIDGNHPLAGATLVFEVELVSRRAMTEAEHAKCGCGSEGCCD